MKIASVFLDLDDTILDFRWAEERSLREALRAVGVELTQEMHRRYRAINCRQWELLEEGALSREEVLTSRFGILFREYGIDASPERVCDAYERGLGVGHRFMPGAEALLQTLHGRYGLYLASNGSAAVQASRIESAGLAKWMDGIFISEELGADKPSRRYFDLCFSRIQDLDPHRAIIVGDSLTSDIRGGLNAGIRTCWYDPWDRPTRPDICPDHTIRDLAELPALLESLFEKEDHICKRS
ncbi:MAG: YjjG family noncanonical pyrimidine nucleotidase [Oscillospiraceae bacterium]|nr:YjjG family noncanonical pyrimidine nucleotidase [Oscillospiraceae bacterium]